jgi:hypothetical protein
VTEESQVCRFFPFVALRVRMTGQVVFQNKGYALFSRIYGIIIRLHSPDVEESKGE